MVQGISFFLTLYVLVCTSFRYDLKHTPELSVFTNKGDKLILSSCTNRLLTRVHALSHATSSHRLKYKAMHLASSNIRQSWRRDDSSGNRMEFQTRRCAVLWKKVVELWSVITWSSLDFLHGMNYKERGDVGLKATIGAYECTSLWSMERWIRVSTCRRPSVPNSSAWSEDSRLWRHQVTDNHIDI